MIALAGVHHVALLVRDLASTERFYRDLLGLPVLRRWPTPDGQGERSVWLGLGDGAFLALERAAPGAPPKGDGGGAGWHLLALRITAAERARWLERFAQAGVAVTHQTPYTIYVADPEGNRIGLSHHPAASDADRHV